MTVMVIKKNELPAWKTFVSPNFGALEIDTIIAVEALAFAIATGPVGLKVSNISDTDAVAAVLWYLYEEGGLMALE